MKFRSNSSKPLPEASGEISYTDETTCHSEAYSAVLCLLPHTESVKGPRRPSEGEYKTCLFTAGMKMSSVEGQCEGDFPSESLQVISNTSCSFFKLPLLSAHGALLLDLLRVQPFQDAVHVETMGALTPDQRAVVSGDFTVWTAAVKRHPADPTVLIVGHPQPGRHPVPLPDLYLHPTC